MVTIVQIPVEHQGITHNSFILIIILHISSQSIWVVFYGFMHLFTIKSTGGNQFINFNSLFVILVLCLTMFHLLYKPVRTNPSLQRVSIFSSFWHLRTVVICCPGLVLGKITPTEDHTWWEHTAQYTWLHGRESSSYHNASVPNTFPDHSPFNPVFSHAVRQQISDVCWTTGSSGWLYITCFCPQ